jgi:hypothetical protein
MVVKKKHTSRPYMFSMLKWTFTPG